MRPSPRMGPPVLDIRSGARGSKVGSRRTADTPNDLLCLGERATVGRGMDGDPELDVTLSDGRQSATFRIAPVDGAVEAWAILQPFGPVAVVIGRAAAVEARSRLDTVIAERLTAGWVPVDVGSAGAPLEPAMPLPTDLVLQ